MQKFELGLPPHDYSGKLIIFDGIDGSGKTTLLRKAQSFASSIGKDAEVVRLIDPSLSSASSYLKYTQDPSGSVGRGVDLLGLSLVCTGFRLDCVRSTVMPKLENGAWVFCDRYVYTAWAEFIAFPYNARDCAALLDLLCLFPKPDISFLTSASAQICISRIRERESEQKKTLDQSYYENLIDIFHSVANHNDMVVIDTEDTETDCISYVCGMLSELDGIEREV
jgi:dTMP kinase